MKKLFFISKSKKHITINLFGAKLALKRFFDFKTYLSFMYKKVEPKTILIIEINDCHYETIPGLCKYCTDLKYNVDVLTRENAEKVFQNLSLPNLRIFECNTATFDKIYSTYNFSKYDRIIYNSKRIYINGKNSSMDGFDISECYKQVKTGIKENIYLQHHIDKLFDTPIDKQIILANPTKNPNLENHVVNAHYFRKNIKRNIKNDITNFISIGELSNTRRNATLLIDSTKQLHSLGITNFKITIIGMGTLEELPVEIQQYFNILGRVDYQTMFDYLNKADFILPLLDPDIDAHRRYMDSGTSGTFQLIYGFNKPCIIHKTFADIYDFTNEDSIIYENNLDLSSAMQKAINLEQNEYKKLQDRLNLMVNKIEEESLENLQGVLND